LAQAEETISM
jgi:hypothetical protein